MKTISFDLDNTLIHSNKAHVIAFQNAFKKYKLKKISRREIIKLLDGRFASQIVKKPFPFFTNEKAKEIAKEHNKLIEKTAEHARKINNVKKTIASLRKKFQVVLLTNCTKAETEALLKGARINKKIFNSIITKNFAGEIKSKPEEFKAKALKKLKASYHVGDTIYDVKAAKIARAKAIAVLSGNVSKAKLAKAKPFAIIKNILELQEIPEISKILK